MTVKTHKKSNPAELKANGLKATQPRLKILEIFQKSDVKHLSAEDVYRILLADDLEIGLATVYRVLAQFEQAGLLARRHFEKGKSVYELNEGDHHDHIVCIKCGRVVEFTDAQIEERQPIVAKEKGFELLEHSLSLYGRCIPACPEE